MFLPLYANFDHKGKQNLVVRRKDDVAIHNDL